MIKASIVGASGYSGVYLTYALSSRKDVVIQHITSNKYAGKSIKEVFPSFYKASSLVFEKYDKNEISASSDVVFLSLPHGESSKLVSGLIKKNKNLRLIDIGADFRFDNINEYEEIYGKHGLPDFNDQFVYGLADIYQDKIKKSKYVANPGCYPTGALIPLLPLFTKKIVDLSSPIIIDSKSGLSGAGRSLSLSKLFCEAENSVRAYSVWTHRHLPEIKEKINNAEIIFTPHIIPVARGILTTIYIKLKGGVTEKKIADIYSEIFDNNPFVSILENDLLPDIKNVIYSNNCHISCKKNKNYLILISAIDNLGKGASLQAIQNMNLMFGLKPNFGINDYTPYP
jgi:N-acetyl-gamma-glutamyl-phosphate reductase